MKAVTVPQPKASLIVHGVKWILTQPDPTDHRGRIGIVAGMHRVGAHALLLDWEHQGLPVGTGDPTWDSMCLRDDEAESSFEPGAWTSANTRCVPMTFGALIGTVELYDCVPIELVLGRCAEDQLPYGDFQRGRWAWLFRDPQPCTPVPMPGFQGWREVEL